MQAYMWHIICMCKYDLKRATGSMWILTWYVHCFFFLPQTRYVSNSKDHRYRRPYATLLKYTMQNSIHCVLRFWFELTVHVRSKRRRCQSSTEYEGSISYIWLDFSYLCKASTRFYQTKTQGQQVSQELDSVRGLIYVWYSWFIGYVTCLYRVKETIGAGSSLECTRFRLNIKAALSCLVVHILD